MNNQDLALLPDSEWLVIVGQSKARFDMREFGTLLENYPKMDELLDIAYTAEVFDESQTQDYEVQFSIDLLAEATVLKVESPQVEALLVIKIDRAIIVELLNERSFESLLDFESAGLDLESLTEFGLRMNEPQEISTGVDLVWKLYRK